MTIEVLYSNNEYTISGFSKEDIKVYWTTKVKNIKTLTYLFDLNKGEINIRFKNPLDKRRIYFYLISSTNYRIIAERKVNVPNMTNLRDMGDYQTKDGMFVRPGLLYRSDDLFKLNKNEVNYLKHMNIHSIIDYRSLDERTKRPNTEIPNSHYYVCSPNSDVAKLASSTLETDKDRVDTIIEMVKSKDNKSFISESEHGMEKEMKRFVEDDISITAFKSMMAIVKQENSYPLIHHCRGGKDRTGYGTALILFALGVPKKTIIHDYMLTAEMNYKRNKKRMDDYKIYTDNKDVLAILYTAMSTKQSFIESSISAIEKHSNDIETYLTNTLNLRLEDINTMKKNYLYNPYDTNEIIRLKKIANPN